MSEPPPAGRLRQAQVIVNPISGLARRALALGAFLATLRAEGVEAIETRTEGPGHARELAREACRRGREALVVVGGDGTVNEAVNGLELGALPVGTLPTGTSNILARDLKIPFDPVRAARVIAAGRRRHLDVGLVNGRRFLMVVGIGWDAHVVNAVSANRKGHLGKHRYVIPILEALFDYRFPTLRVSMAEGGPAHEARLVFVCNTRNYAAYFALTPDARPDDGVLDVLSLTRGGARDVVRWMAAALRGTLWRYREARCAQGRELLVTADEPVPFQLDGDPGGTTPVRITMEARTLEVIVP